jgi:hypothetical protein
MEALLTHCRLCSRLPYPQDKPMASVATVTVKRIEQIQKQLRGIYVLATD